MRIFLVTLFAVCFSFAATVVPTTKLGLRSRTVSVPAMAGGTADVSEIIDVGNFTKGSVQADGTFGTTTFTVQMSNNGTAWVTAKDTAGNDLTFTAAGLKLLQLGAKFIRLQAPSGTGTGLIAVIQLTE